MICSNKLFLILLSLFAGVQLFAAPPVPFSGKISVYGKNFHGNALFSFSIVDGEGVVHWRNADESDAAIEIFVLNGRYLALLGGQGMKALPPDLFLKNENLFFRVSVDLQDGKGMRLLEPDQQITSSPYALAAEFAQLADRAVISDGVKTGGITAGMLEQRLLEDLNRTFELGPISHDMLEEALQDDLNRTVRLQDLSTEVSQSINRPITREMLPQGVRDELNATITRDRLSADVRADLNRTIGIGNLSSEVTEKLDREFTIEPGSIGKALLAKDVRDDLNRTITRDRLSEDIIADLNRTVRLQDLSEEVSQSINRSITLSDLDSQVIAELNDTIATGSISLTQLSQGVRDELNATITRDRLSADIRADLNRTIGIANLSTEVTDKLNQTFSIDPGSITLDQLSQQVRDDINRTITRDRLSSDVLSDINRTITKSMLSQEVLDELNASIGPSNLSSEVSNALKPVVVGQPSSVVEHAGMPAYLAVDATGGDNTYQWKKDGVDIVGASNKILSIADLNASQHEGNYTVVVSNAFGSVTSSVAQLDVNGSLTEGLVGWWKFDETDGNIAYDSSGNGNDGNLTNGPTWTEGKIRGALSFDGVDDHIVLSSTTGLNVQHISIAAFLYSEDRINKGLIFEKKTQYLLFFESHGVLRWRTFAPSFHDLTVPVNDTTNRMPWVHLSATYNGASKKVFIDGILADSVSTSGTFTFGDTSESSIGKMISNDNYFFEQIIDDLRIYDRALSAFEVKALYELGEQPVQEGGSGTTTVVNGTVADGSIGLSKLSSEVSNALKPVVVGQPSSVVGVDGARTYLEVNATGVNLSYQWKKEGVDIAGATSGTLSITDLNASQHEGNYTVVVNNSLGSVTSSVIQLDVNGSLTEGLVGWWKFDEVDGNISHDSSGNGNDGNLTNGPTWTVGKIGGALSFDGIDDYMITPNFEGIGGTNPRSITAWIKTTTLDGIICSYGNIQAGEKWTFRVSEPNGTIRTEIENGYKKGINQINKGQWTFVSSILHTGSNNISDVVHYVNGNFENYSDLTPLLLDTNLSSKFTVGARSKNDGTLARWAPRFKGLIDDIRIYDRALSALEVKALYELGENPVQESGSGTTMVVNGTVADGSIGLSKLSSEVSNALKPVVVEQPSSVVEHAGMPTYLAVDATGGDNTYQWKKNGVDIAGATSRTLAIADLNASQHEGNYTVVVSNAFGSTTSSVAQIDVNGSLTEGLVGWWKFDETEGNIAYDSSGNERDGNFSAGGSWVNGKIGGAIDLNGSSDGTSKIEVLNYKGILGKSARSVSAWIKAFDDSHSRTIITWGQENRYHFFVAGGGNQPGALRLAIGGAFVLGTQKVNKNEWFLVTAVSEENSSIANSTIYINSEVEQFSEQWGKTINTQEGANLSIGSQFKGLLDDVRIYDRALSAVEVKALYELGEQPVQESGSGTTMVVNGTVADGSITASKIADQTITTNQLSEQILKYLKPEITQQPTAGTIFADTNGTISVSAEGKYLSYQWKKNGVNLAGETNATLTITDANATQHDGNYSVVVSNDFGSVESGNLEIQITDSLMNGLVGWWKFDETDGTIAYDSSGNGNNGNLTNGPTWVAGKIGGALSFDGTDDRLKLPHSLLNGLRDFSMSLYFNESTNNTDQHHFLSAANSSNANNFVYGLTASYKFTLNDGVTDTMIIEHQSNHAFSDWSSIIVTRNSTTTKIFVQGELEAQGTHSGNSLSVSNNGLWIGGDQDSVGGGFSGGQQLNGLLDDVRIYNRAISNAEVQAIYQLGQ